MGCSFGNNSVLEGSGIRRFVNSIIVLYEGRIVSFSCDEIKGLYFSFLLFSYE